MDCERNYRSIVYKNLLKINSASFKKFVDSNFQNRNKLVTINLLQDRRCNETKTIFKYGTNQGIRTPCGSKNFIEKPISCHFFIVLPVSEETVVENFMKFLRIQRPIDFQRNFSQLAGCPHTRVKVRSFFITFNDLCLDCDFFTCELINF